MWREIIGRPEETDLVLVKANSEIKLHGVYYSPQTNKTYLLDGYGWFVKVESNTKGE